MALVSHRSSSTNNSSYRCCEVSFSLDIRQAERKIQPNLYLTLSVCFCVVVSFYLFKLNFDPTND